MFSRHEDDGSIDDVGGVCGAAEFTARPREVFIQGHNLDLLGS
jgi:hypothetical protein